MSKQMQDNQENNKIELKSQIALDKSKKHNNHEYDENIRILCDRTLTQKAKMDYIGKNALTAMKKFGLIDKDFNVSPFLEEVVEDDSVLQHRIGGMVLLNNADPVFRKLAWLVMKVRAFNEYTYATFFHTVKDYSWDNFKMLEKDIKTFMKNEKPEERSDFVEKFKEILKDPDYEIDSNKESVEKYFSSASSYGSLFMTFWNYFCPHICHFDTQRLVDFLETDEPFNENTSKEFFTSNIIIPNDYNSIDVAENYLLSGSFVENEDDKNGVVFEDACYQVANHFKDNNYKVVSKGSVDKDNHILLTAPGKTHDMHVLGDENVFMIEVTKATGKNQLGYESGCIDHLFSSRFNKNNYMIFVAPEVHYKTKEYFASEYSNRIRKNPKKARNTNPIVCMNTEQYVKFVKNFKYSNEFEIGAFLKGQAFIYGDVAPHEFDVSKNNTRRQRATI